MPKTKEQNNLLKSKRKQDIVFSALKVFCEKGYEGTTIDDIVKKAECSHGLFYHYFKSKQEIFKAIIENAIENSDNHLEQILKEELSCVEKLRKIIIHLFNNLKNNESVVYYFYFFFSKMFTENLSSAYKNKPHPKNNKSIFFMIEELFEQGIKNNEFKNDYSAKEYAKLFHSIIQGITYAYAVLPFEFKKSFNPPNVELIVDIFKNNSI